MAAFTERLSSTCKNKIIVTGMVRLEYVGLLIGMRCGRLFPALTVQFPV